MTCNTPKPCGRVALSSHAALLCHTGGPASHPRCLWKRLRYGSSWKFCPCLQKQRSSDVVSDGLSFFYLLCKRKCVLPGVVLLGAYLWNLSGAALLLPFWKHSDQSMNREEVNGKTKVVQNLLIFWKLILKHFLVFSEDITCK